MDIDVVPCTHTVLTNSCGTLEELTPTHQSSWTYPTSSSALSLPLLPPQILSPTSSPLATFVLPLLLPLLPASNLSCSLQKSLPEFGLAATASLPSSWAPSPTLCQPSSGRACALCARQLLQPLRALEGHFCGASRVYIRSWHVQQTPQITCPHIIYNGWYALSLNNNKLNKQSKTQVQG